jgi:hypothetical protein
MGHDMCKRHKTCTETFGRETSAEILFRRYSPRYDDNIKMHLRKADRKVVNWIELARNMVQSHVFVNTVMNCRGYIARANIFLS